MDQFNYYIRLIGVKLNKYFLKTHKNYSTYYDIILKPLFLAIPILYILFFIIKFIFNIYYVIVYLNMVHGFYNNYFTNTLLETFTENHIRYMYLIGLIMGEKKRRKHLLIFTINKCYTTILKIFKFCNNNIK